jgi:hypothetical protein
MIDQSKPVCDKDDGDCSLDVSLEKRKFMILTDDVEVFIARDVGNIIQNW